MSMKGNYSLKVKHNNMKEKPYNKIINCARTPEPEKRNEKFDKDKMLKKDTSDKKLKLQRNESRLLSSDKKSKNPKDGVIKLAKILKEKTTREKETVFKKMYEFSTAAKTNISVMSNKFQTAENF